MRHLAAGAQCTDYGSRRRRRRRAARDGFARTRVARAYGYVYPHMHIERMRDVAL